MAPHLPGHSPPSRFWLLNPTLAELRTSRQSRGTLAPSMTMSKGGWSSSHFLKRRNGLPGPTEAQRTRPGAGVPHVHGEPRDHALQQGFFLAHSVAGFPSWFCFDIASRSLIDTWINCVKSVGLQFAGCFRGCLEALPEALPLRSLFSRAPPAPPWASASVPRHAPHSPRSAGHASPARPQSPWPGAARAPLAPAARHRRPPPPQAP